MLETITRHKILKHVEKLGAAKRNPKREEYPEGDDVPGRIPAPDEAAIAADLIEKALAGLDERYATVFSLRLQGHTEEEIAAKLGCALRLRPHQAVPDSRSAGTAVGGKGPITRTSLPERLGRAESGSCYEGMRRAARTHPRLKGDMAPD